MTTLEIIQDRLPDLDTALKRAEGRNAVLEDRGGARLAEWLPTERLHELGFTVNEGFDVSTWTVKVWDAETVMAQVKDDVAFAFTKALDQRGISAGLMHDVCMMWARIFGFEIDPEDYRQYGLPGIKALALALELPNSIGDDRGDEDKYAG